MQGEMVKISRLELENVKRVRAVELEPSTTGLTTIGGRNRQGKTSILDAIIYGLGGEKYRPSALQREGSSAEAHIKIKLSNGLMVERAGKNAALKVIDPMGMKAGQRLLDEFVEELALNLPKFMVMNDKDKGRVLLSILGIEDKLITIDAEEKAAYDERTVQGRIADQKEKYAAEMPEWHDVPEDVQTPAALVAESQAIMARNAERQALRKRVADIEARAEVAESLAKRKQDRISELQAMLRVAEAEYAEANASARQAFVELKVAQETVIDRDESSADIERRMADLEEINSKVRANNDKRKAIEDAADAREAVAILTAKVEAARAKRSALLASVELPLPGLSVEDGELIYQGQKWDCMSGCEQIKVACAIVRKRKPACGFILLDKLESFDKQQLAELNDWLVAEGLQAIATRVSTGDECSIIIEDGMVAGGNEPVVVTLDW